MRILVLGVRGIPGVEGGAEKNAENLFPAMTDHYDVRMLCLRKFCDVESYHGIRINRVGTVRLFGTDKILYYIASMWYAVRWWPDIIHCQGLNAAILVWFYKLVARRVVVRYGSVDYLNAKWGPIGKLGFRFCEWQLRWADAVIAVTPSLRERLVKRGIGQRMVVIPNAVDESDEAIDERVLKRFDLVTGCFVLSVGRITWQKDFGTLLEAFQAARAAAPELGKLVIVGGDDGSGCLEQLQARAGSEIVFTGRLHRREVLALYATTRLYVNSSRHEGFSNAILEAISYLRPLVVSNIVENRDLPLAAHQFFPVGDVQALRGRILAALAEPERFVPDRTRFMVWPQVVQATIDLYEALFDKNGAEVLPEAHTR